MMTLPRPDHASDLTPQGAADTDASVSRDAALIALAREASLLALSAGREAAGSGQGSSTRTLAMIALAAETERVARRIETAIEAMRRAGAQDGPSDAQIAAAAAALAAARAIGAHSPTPVEGTRVAAEGFAAAAAALDVLPAVEVGPIGKSAAARAN